MRIDGARPVAQDFLRGILIVASTCAWAACGGENRLESPRVLISPHPAPSTSASSSPLPVTLATPMIVSYPGRACLLRSSGTIACWGEGLASGALPTVIDTLEATSIALTQHGLLVRDRRGQVLAGLKGRELSFAPRPELEYAFNESCSDGTCCRVDKGSVLCSGSNSFDRLGNDGPHRPALEPVPGVSEAVSVSVGASHVCALLKSGEVSCWGSNQDGQLGYGSSDRGKRGPVLVHGLSDVVQVRNGHRASCARCRDGAVRCWGSNSFHELGQDKAREANSPVLVEGIPPAVDLSLASFHGCIVGRQGDVWCWGFNDYGQLGDGTTRKSNRPVQAKGLKDAIAVTTQHQVTCAMLRDESAWCWGNRERGKLGDGVVSEHQEPVDVPGVTGATGVCTRMMDACAVGADHALRCWREGRLSVERKADVLACDDRCVLLTNGKVECDNPMAGLDNMVSVSTSTLRGCGIRKDGAVLCWGTTFGPDSKPKVAFRDAVKLGSGPRASCATRSDGSMWCWGDVARRSPAPRAPIKPEGLEGVADISMDKELDLPGGCVVRADSTVACWYWDLAVIKDGKLNLRHKAKAGITGAASVFGGPEQGCAILRDGRVQCWGTKTSGPSEESAFVPGLSDATSIAMGGDYRCAVRKSGMASCWGDNSHGQLGPAFARNQLTPIAVSGLR